MLYLIIILAIIIIVTGIILYSDKDNMSSSHTWEALGGGLLAGIFGGLFVCLMTSVIIKTEMRKKLNNYQYPAICDTMVMNIPIIALKDNNSLGGSFFIGSGSIGSVTYYHFMYEAQRGKVIDKLTSEDEIYFNDNDSINPRLEKHILYPKNYRNMEYWYLVSPTKIYWKFYIPKGSINTQYKIDME